VESGFYRCEYHAPCLRLRASHHVSTAITKEGPPIMTVAITSMENFTIVCVKLELEERIVAVLIPVCAPALDREFQVRKMGRLHDGLTKRGGLMPQEESSHRARAGVCTERSGVFYRAFGGIKRQRLEARSVAPVACICNRGHGPSHKMSSCLRRNS
jgi:hypothetical protein